jgi:segregation and condensation protein B
MSDMDDRVSAAPEDLGPVAGRQPMICELEDSRRVARGRAVVPLDDPAEPLHREGEEEEPVRSRGNGSRNRAEPAPLRRVLEAVLFATDRPVMVDQLLCAVPEQSPSSVECELQAMAAAYKDAGFGFQLLQSGEGYWLRTDPELHEYVHRLLIGKRRARLSRAAMETLAIAAYRQPITRGEMEEIRGVDCGQVLHTLMERNLVTVRGRSQALGRPLLYGTTDEFLHYFGIKSLADLPSPEELQSLIGSDPTMEDEIRSALSAQGLTEAEPAAASDDEFEAMGAAGTPACAPEDATADLPQTGTAFPFADAGGPLTAAC